LPGTPIFMNYISCLHSCSPAGICFVGNTTGKAMKVEIEVFDVSDPSSYSYYYTAHKINTVRELNVEL
jgi:hypothetical protein